MSQIKDLKVFVSERLHAAASEILGAIEKTIADYEEQASRLKEENERHRSVLDIILKSKLPQQEAGHANKSAPAAAQPLESDSRFKCKTREAAFTAPSDLQCVFTSRADFLKFAASGNCPYCLKRVQATEAHLMRRHYLFAIHFVQDGTEKFVIPCMCKDKIQGRSHWHCPYCKKIIFRKCNFEGHLSKQHCYTILQQSQDSETSHPSVSVFEEDVPLSPEPWCLPELGSLDQEDQQASLLLHIKEEAEQVSHPEEQYSEQLSIKGELIQKGSNQMGEPSLEPNHTQDSAFNIVFVDSFIQDISEISRVESRKGHPPPNSSNRAMETQLDSGVSEITVPTGRPQHTTGNIAVAEDGSCNKTKQWKNSQRPRSSLKRVKRPLPSVSLKIKKSAQLSASQNPTGSHCCKACGKVFHYMYTLRTHVQTHAMDKISICGICGKRLESAETLVQHLQSHTKNNKCGTCGKQFSSMCRLKRHRRFHRAKGLNVMS